ncbi:MAG: hypothetical protein MUE81_07740 [Thermoflexibacter sp.]|jgi:hypothetical protein|nr:hypothetical protein [Thermoflexibacter sp.]
MLTLDIPKEKVPILYQFKELGFDSEVDLILYAFHLLEKELQRRKELSFSAQLYAEMYEEDEELRFLTESALNDMNI